MEWPDSCLRKKLPTLPHQRRHCTGQGVGALEPLERRSCTGFAQRTQQRRQPDRDVFHARFQCVEDASAFRKLCRIQFREDDRQHLRFQIGPRCRSSQQTAQLLRDALFGHAVQMAAERSGRLPGGRVDGKAEPGREPVEPQDAQGVFLEPALRLPHRPHDAGGKVVLPAERVDEPFFGVIGHGVDGEIPPGQVFFYVRHKGDVVRVAAVRIRPLGAEGRDLVQFSAVFDGHGAVLQARRDAVRFPEQLQHLFGGCAGAEVPVVRGLAKQTVPHAAAHRISGMARRMEARQQGRCTGVQREGNGLSCHEDSSSYRKMICCPSTPHSTAGKAASAAGRAASGSVMMGE